MAASAPRRFVRERPRLVVHELQQLHARCHLLERASDPLHHERGRRRPLDERGAQVPPATDEGEACLASVARPVGTKEVFVHRQVQTATHEQIERRRDALSVGARAEPPKVRAANLSADLREARRAAVEQLAAVVADGVIDRRWSVHAIGAHTQEVHQVGACEHHAVEPGRASSLTLEQHRPEAVYRVPVAQLHARVGQWPPLGPESAVAGHRRAARASNARAIVLRAQPRLHRHVAIDLHHRRRQ
eukprot:7244753-Prymnesium_polylepis.1